MATSSARPFKIWNSDRSLKKSVIASSLEELIQKGCSKLGLSSSSQLQVVLEEDGTQVEDEDYFDLLPSNCIFLFLHMNERWQPAGQGEIAVRDEVDYAGDYNMRDNIHSLAHSLRQDISNIITFSSEQLQQLVDCEASTLAHILGQTERHAIAVQSACQRHLDEHAQSVEAINLLKLYQQASASSGDRVKKRRKIDKSS